MTIIEFSPDQLIWWAGAAILLLALIVAPFAGRSKPKTDLTAVEKPEAVDSANPGQGGSIDFEDSESPHMGAASRSFESDQSSVGTLSDMEASTGLSLSHPADKVGDSELDQLFDDLANKRPEDKAEPNVDSNLPGTSAETVETMELELEPVPDMIESLQVPDVEVMDLPDTLDIESEPEDPSPAAREDKTFDGDIKTSLSPEAGLDDNQLRREVAGVFTERGDPEAANSLLERVSMFEGAKGTGVEAYEVEAAGESAQSVGVPLGGDVETKLDLALAYVEIGDGASATDLINQIASEGTATQRGQAEELRQRL